MSGCERMEEVVCASGGGGVSECKPAQPLEHGAPRCVARAGGCATWDEEAGDFLHRMG